MSERKNRQMELMLAPAREKLMGRNIADLCEKAGVVYDEDTDDLLVPSLGEYIRIRLPDYTVLQDLDMWRHLTLLQYLDTADGTPLTGTEIGLGDMRGGLSRGLGFDKDIGLMFARDCREATAEDVARACRALGGRILSGSADVTAVIDYAPRFPITVRFWCGDDEFPPSGKTLVDAAAEHYLTLEAAGGACSSTVQAIIRGLQHSGA
ncbi:MAG: DUF3786 domain-containing protein [Oscillospiraceae bacterium]|nr:DUF3786 domain-containing protein [Oscillospiraceae bacterium]